MRKQNRVVLITGCSSGIGGALANAFHDNGDTVYATARRLHSMSALQQKGLLVAELDVGSSEQIQNIMKRIEIEQGRLDVLINNAGYAAIGPAAEIPVSQLSKEFDVNVFAPMRLLQAALPLLRINKGIIIQIGSVGATLTTPFAGAYCASKAALHSLTDALRMELAPFGIRVLCVAPGAIRSNFGDNSSQGLQQTLQADSWYTALRDTIERRARMSQENPTPADALARRIVMEAGKVNPRAVLRFGRGAYLLFYLKRLLPEKLLDQILSRKFKLNRLG